MNDREILGAFSGGSIRLAGSAPVIWVCTADLRWNGDVLEQRWAQQFRDEHEWRAVPKAANGS